MIAHLNNTQKGIVYALIGYTAFAFNDVNAKWLVNDFPPLQVACLQALLGALFFLSLNKFIGGWAGLSCKKERKIHIMRGVVNTVLSIVLMISFMTLPLVDIYAMIFTIPFFAVILSRIFYGETSDLKSWAAIIVGFAGVLIILRPGMDMEAALLLPLAAAFMVAVNVVAAKSLTKSSPFLLGFYPLVITTLLTLPFMIGDFIMPDLRHALHFMLSGVLISVAITTVSMAFRITASHKVTPFIYTEMIWGILFGYLVFGDVPDALMLVGSAIIIGSGLYIILDARKKKRG